MTAFDKLRRIVAESLHAPPEQITPDRQVRDLLADSLNLAELIMAIEEEFGVALPDEIAERFAVGVHNMTLGQLAAEVERLLD